jgi:hypothetical protein
MPEPSTEVLAWRVHLAARHPRRTGLLVTIIVLASAWAVVVFGHPVALAVTAALLTLATSEYLFPQRFVFTEEYAEARGPLFWRRVPWKEVKRVYVGKGEIKLSPLKYGGPREAFRGVVLRLQDNDETVLAEVRRLREAAGAAPEDGSPNPDAAPGSRA